MKEDLRVALESGKNNKYIQNKGKYFRGIKSNVFFTIIIFKTLNIHCVFIMSHLKNG